MSGRDSCPKQSLTRSRLRKTLHTLLDTILCLTAAGRRTSGLRRATWLLNPSLTPLRPHKTRSMTAHLRLEKLLCLLHLLR